MSELSFSQSERRNFAVPILIAVIVLGVAFAGIYLYMPHRVADLSVTHVALLPTHTVFATGSKLVGAQQEVQDDLYVAVTVRVDDRLHDPLYISNLGGTLNTQDDAVVTSSAIQKSDLNNITVTFPALKPLMSTPLAREAEIKPGDHAEGMVLIHFPITEDVWKQRKSATVNIEFYHQGTFSVDIPKP
ncbi:MAG TPA: hypothetical protein VGN01_14095 [Acidobacteriaceae bacterium]